MAVPADRRPRRDAVHQQYFGDPRALGLTSPQYAAKFTSSDTTLNAVFDLVQRSALYSMQQQFVDTPTREKGQFLQDAVNESYATMLGSGGAFADPQGDSRIHGLATPFLARWSPERRLSQRG
jgi:hypothetical protein